MWPPTFVRPLSAEEKQVLLAGLHSRDAFTLRRSLILLASAEGQKPAAIARNLHCTAATVRNAIAAFEAAGGVSLTAKSSAPKQPAAIWPAERNDDLRALIHQGPRNFGKPRSTWTLDLLAEVCYERGMTTRKLTGEAIRCILVRLDINWKRDKHWMTSPDPHYAVKKARRDRLIRLAQRHPEWVLGFEDEVWWSRLARPALHAWTDGQPLKIQLLKVDDDDPDPETIACYGFLRADSHRVVLRFVEDRPVADVTIQFLEWLCGAVSEEGKKVLIVVWDDASWHTAEVVCSWVKEHNQQAALTGTAKVVICELPVASPWLNNIEPCWTHAKKAIVEPDRKLTAEETTTRVCEHFGCDVLPFLKTTVAPEESGEVTTCGS